MNKRQYVSDTILINQYKTGDKSVLPILIKRYHKIFCEKAFWVTNNKESSKDIAQECWLIIIDKLHTLENVKSFKNWAFRIVYTTSIDSIKFINSENKKLMQISTDVKDDVVDEGEYRISLLKALSKAINQLPKSKHDIIRLFYLEEYSIKEISTFLNIPLGTVKSRLFKSREKLKSIIKSMDYEK